MDTITTRFPYPLLGSLGIPWVYPLETLGPLAANGFNSTTDVMVANRQSTELTQLALHTLA